MTKILSSFYVDISLAFTAFRLVLYLKHSRTLAVAVLEDSKHLQVHNFLPKLLELTDVMKSCCHCAGGYLFWANAVCFTRHVLYCYLPLAVVGKLTLQGLHTCLAFLHAGAAYTGVDSIGDAMAYPTGTIACCPLDAGQMIDRHDRPIADLGTQNWAQTKDLIVMWWCCRLVVSARMTCSCSCWVRELVDLELTWHRLTRSSSTTVIGSVNFMVLFEWM